MHVPPFALAAPRVVRMARKNPLWGRRGTMVSTADLLVRIVWDRPGPIAYVSTDPLVSGHNTKKEDMMCPVQPCLQFGIVVKRKLGAAVVRNRIKRRLRQAIPALVQDAWLGGTVLPAPCAWVVIVKSNALATCTVHALQLQLQNLWSQVMAAGVLSSTLRQPYQGMAHTTVGRGRAWHSPTASSGFGV